MTSSTDLKKHHISLLHYWNNGIRSARVIHRETNIPLRTIYYNINKLKKTNSLKHRGGNGRPIVLCPIEKKAIGQYIRRNNEITVKEIKEKLSSAYQSSVSISTIRRYLIKSGYRNVLPRSTHMLTSEHKQRRIQWAQKHKNYDFTHTVFTDETSFQLFRNTVRRWTKCPNNESKRIPKNRQKVQMWGAISVRGVLTCHTFRCNLDGSYYVHILKNYLLPAAKQEFHQKWCLQQDNDPKHTSNISKQFINNKVPRLLEWPSNSPDVNPVENVWSIVKRKVEKRKPKNIDELELFLCEEFKNVDINSVMNIVMSMKKRCLSLIESKGERIKY
jgi:transposase